MVDFTKIDTYFNEAGSYRKQERQKPKRRSRFLRFLKLFMPSVAAVLIGLILIFPHFEKSTIVNDYDLTKPKKGELEKLHAEKTVFSVTDRHGKVSTFRADTMDEKEAGSKVIKIVHPNGKIPLKKDNAFIDVISEIGYFDQENNHITVEKKVKAVYDNETTLETDYAEYDFKTSYAKGNEPIVAHGSWGRLWADGFAYDKSKRILYLQKNSKVVHENSVLTASKQVRYYQALNKIEAEGNVVLTTNESVLYADRAVIWFMGTENMQIKKVEAFENVKVVSQGTIAKADTGLYLPLNDKVELNGQVSIEKDGNVVYGDKAVTNLKTMVSKITMNDNKRVSGIIRGTSIRRKK